MGHEKNRPITDGTQSNLYLIIKYPSKKLTRIKSFVRLAVCHINYPENCKIFPPMPTISQKKFTQGNPPLKPAHRVGTSYIAVCALGEDAARPFGPAHVRAACF